MKEVAAHVIILCFSVVDPPSFETITSKWTNIITQHWPNVPILLTGLKTDLRSSGQVVLDLERAGQVPVSSDQGEKLAQKIGAKMYLECSALTQEGIRKVVDEALNLALEHVQEQNSSRNNGKGRGRCIRAR